MLKVKLNYANIMENWHLKYRCLFAYFTELISIMNDKDDLIQRNRFKEVRRDYAMLQDAKKKGKRTIPIKLLDSLDDWEIELRNLEQKYGLNMPKKSDARTAML